MGTNLGIQRQVFIREPYALRIDLRYQCEIIIDGSSGAACGAEEGVLSWVQQRVQNCMK